MGARPNSGVDVGCYRLIITNESGASVLRQALSVVLTAGLALMEADPEVEARSWVLRVSDTAMGETVAERRYRSRRLADRARERAIARYRALPPGGREPAWTSLLDDSA